MKKPRGQRCTYCRRVLEGWQARSRLAATMDHVLPKSKGGKGGLCRKVWCCRQCNTLKRDMLPDDWSAFMESFPQWWMREEFKVPRFTRLPSPEVTTPPLRPPATLPLAYPDDPLAQAAFEGVYRNRLHLLRTPLERDHEHV